MFKIIVFSFYFNETESLSFLLWKSKIVSIILNKCRICSFQEWEWRIPTNRSE